MLLIKLTFTAQYDLSAALFIMHIQGKERGESEHSYIKECKCCEKKNKEINRILQELIDYWFLVPINTCGERESKTGEVKEGRKK